MFYMFKKTRLCISCNENAVTTKQGKYCHPLCKYRYKLFEDIRKNKKVYELRNNRYFIAFRREFLRRYKICSLCGADSQCLHHKIPIKKNKFRIVMLSNCMPLCNKCHSNIHGLKFLLTAFVKRV